MTEEKRKKPNPADRFCWDADDLIITRKREKDEPKPDDGIVY
ncbi:MULTISPECIES: hypothetical protein [Methanoculleus]|uniref:Uncharacterized protein n=1 Tax=Methanoculleus submarinus TaxID=204050 RepID=A0AAX3E907_9EURY|nr:MULTISPECIES: hypothetical protein [Methanoculleus]UYU18600.1 hypothetical protein OH143_00500 [Methanoculleus submarinus]